MSEVAFAKQFLASFDARPQKLSGDYVADPKSLPSQPALTLPRMPKPFPSTSIAQAQPSSTGGANQALEVTLEALRQGPGSPAPVTLNVIAKASVYDLKIQLAARTGYAVDKLKILWQRKPVGDAKTVAEATGTSSGRVNMGVMYVGAPTNAAQHEASGPPSENAQALKDAATLASGSDKTPVAKQQQREGYTVLETAEFWEDLQGYLTQRLRDESVAKEAATLWRQAWQSR